MVGQANQKKKNVFSYGFQITNEVYSFCLKCFDLSTDKELNRNDTVRRLHFFFFLFCRFY